MDQPDEMWQPPLGRVAPEQAQAADAVLPKPCSEAELLRLVRALARRGGNGGPDEAFRGHEVRA